MKTTYITFDEMTDHRNSHNLHRLPSQAMHTMKHRSLRTLHTVLTAIIMLFAVGVQGAWAEDTQLFFFKYDGSSDVTISNQALTATGGTIILERKNGSTKELASESATYATSVPNDLKGNAKGIKIGTGDIWIKITLASGNFQPGDVISITGYQAYTISSTSSRTGDVASGMSTGTGASDYQVGTCKIPNGIETNTLYVQRTSSTCAFAVISVTRPDPTAEKSTDATLSALNVYGTKIDGFASATETYDVTLAYGTTAVPTVTATCADAGATAVVTQASALPGTATAVVTAEDETTTKTYTVNLSVSSTAPTIPTGYDKFWRAEDWDKMVATSSLLTVNGMSVYNVAVDASGQLTADDLGTVSKRFNFGGAGGTGDANRRIEIPITGPCTVTVFGSNGNVGRSVTISDGTNSSPVCTTTDDNKNTLITESYEYTGSAEKLYLYSTTSGFYIYGFGIKYTSSPDPGFEPYAIDLTAENSAQNTPQGWTAVSLPSITVNKEITLSGLSVSGDNAQAIQAAIDAASAAGGGKVIIPAGEWLSGQLFIKSNVVLHLSKNCTLKMLPYGTYPAGKDNYFIGTGNETVNDVIIEGEDFTSIIDGQGAGWWSTFDSDNDTRPAGLVRFSKGTRYLVRNIQFQNSPKPNLVLGQSGNASHFTVHDVNIVNPSSDETEAQADGFAGASHNTDGIPVWGPYCNIYKCNISTGDDNVVFDSNAQYGHVWDCDFGRGHGASIGSNTMNIHDILWDNIRFNGTQSGFKIKTDRGKGNELYNITYQNSTMTGVRDILYMDCWYGSSTKPTPGTELENAAPAKGETTPAWHDITYKNITATNCVYKSSDKNGFPIYFYGLPESHIKNVTIDNVTIEGQKGMFMAYVGENGENGVTFQNDCNITNVKEPTAAAFVQDYSAVHNDDYVAVAERTFKGFELDFTTGGNAADLVKGWSTGGSPTSSGFVFANDRTPSVEATNPTVAVRTYYKNATYGLWLYSAGNDKFTFDVDGPVEISIGQTNQAGSVVVKDANGNTVIDAFSTNGTTTYTYGSSNVVTKQYLGDATTLTVTGAANDLYIPYIKVMPCDKPDVLPEYTVTFYDGNGTSVLGSKQVTQGQPIGEITYNATVPTGSKFRRWKDRDGKEVTSANIVSANMNVYACVTPEETVSGDMDYNYALGTTFFADEHEVIESVSGVGDGNGHGWALNASSSIQVKVAGNATFKLVSCKFPSDRTPKYVLKKGGVTVAEVAATAATDGVEVEMNYEGEATTLALTADDGCYLHSFRVIGNGSVAPEPQEVIWNFSDWDIQSLTCPTIWNGLTIYPAYDNSGTLKSAVDNNSKSIDGYSFTKRFKFGAKSLTSADQNEEKTGYMKFHVFGPTDIVVYGMSSSSTAGNETTLYLSAIGRAIDGYLAKSDPLGGSIGKLTCSYTGAEGDIYLFCDGNAANIYMIKATPVSTPVDPEPTPEFQDFEVVLASGKTGNVVTEAKDASVEFGIALVDGVVTRVAKDAANSIATISGKYNGDHGLTNFKCVVTVPGAVKITTGTCSYDSSADLKVNGTSIIDAPFTGDQKNNCWKNNASNVMYGVYNGTAGEITITKGGYTPYIKVEQYNAENEPQADPDGIYDAVVTNLAQLKSALSYSGTDSKQYKILVKNGTYDFGTEIQTPVKSYVSLIGESRDGVIVKNEPTTEGIQTSVLLLVSGTGTDIENMTLKCTVTPVGGAERSVVIWDKGQNNIFRNLKLIGRQDTYSSDGKPEGAKSYFEDCHIMGTVDFICGSGNVMFENCILDLQQRSSGDVITAPSTYTSETGFVFSNCTIQGDSGQDGKYYLARGWKNDPKATFINTTMKISPASGGISPNDASTPNSKTWKEYGSKNASGTAANVTSNVITESEANMIVSSVVGTLGTDEALQLIELSEPIIADNKLKWKSDTRAIGYYIYKNGVKVATMAASGASSVKARRAQAATEDMEYAVDDPSAAWSVSAINALGAVGKAAAAPVVPVPAVLADVTGDIIWDWTKTGVDGGVIQLTDATTPTKNDEFILSKLIPSTANFKSDALLVRLEYPVRDNKYAQGGKIMFHTTVAGKVAVTFTNTGGSNPDRWLTVNGTKYGSGSGTGNSNARVTTEVDVEAGDVVLSGCVEDGSGQYLRFYSIAFTAKSGPSYPLTATWDFKHGVPSTITSVYLEGKKGKVASDKDGIELDVDANSGKLQYNASGYAQFNKNTIIKVPVTSKYDVVNVEAYPGQAKYTVGGVAATDNVEHNVSEAEATAGYVEIVATGNGYINSISVTQQGAGYVPNENWDPTWDDANNRWIVKTSNNADDAIKATENAKGLTEALKYLNVAANVTGKNKTLYIPNGTYDLGETALTSVPADFHLIGESQDGVLIKNELPFESIKYTATLKIIGANVTLENMTIKCRATYGKEKRDDAGTIADSNAERGVCVWDCGNGTHYSNVTLDGLQDTYYSNGAAGMTATFDNCTVMGNVDFFCGSGDITVNNSTLVVVPCKNSGSKPVICAPATFTNGETQGYLFDNCTVVDGTRVDQEGVSTNISQNLNYYLARAWYAGNGGADRTPRVTFKDTEFEINPKEYWTTMSPEQPGGAPVFNIINTGIQFSDIAKVIDKTNKPFAYATAADRTDPAKVNAGNITGGGEYDLETIMEKMEADGGYTAGTTKTISGHKAIVLQSANTITNGKETRVPMDDAILNAIKANDIIVLDGSGASTDFVVSKYIQLSGVKDKTIVGINGARLCTEWYLTDYFKSLLENVPTSSGTGVNSASTAEGTGGDIHVINNKGVEGDEHIKEEGEYLTRKTLLEATGDKYEKYRYSGIFYIDHSSNLIIRNFKFVGPGSLDCAGYDLMAIIDDTHHCWVDHCEFIDGMDGNFDITNRSDFVTVSWCQFRYTDRSYAHQNTNLVGSSDEKTDDRQKLNITFAYNEWGANCRARMPMARFGRIHMLNNYYNCAGNSEYAMNPRKESEFLIQGNYWEKGVRRAYNPSGQTAITWDSSNYYADKAAEKAGENTGSTVTVPYQYSALMLDPHKVPEAIDLNCGAKLYQKPYFTTNLGVADNTPGTPELQHNAELTEELKSDGLVFSVWAENAHTFQWYKQDIALDGIPGEWQMLDGENRNTYTYKPVTGVEFNLKCQAFGVSGETTSDVLKVNIDGLAAPYYLGGVPTEMQTVYTGTPMTFTANFKDAQGYQWYKSATEDRADATAIDGATSNTYTYNPAAAEIFYLYCVASNSNGKGDGYSDVVKVKGIYRDVKFHYYGWYDESISHSAETVIGGTGGLTTFTTACSTEGTKCRAELNSYTVESTQEKISGLRIYSCADHTNYAEGTYVLFTLNNALAAGDNIKLSAYTGSTSNPAGNYGYYVCTAAARTNDNEVARVAVTGGSNVLCEAEFVIPESFAGATTLYLIPFVGKAGANVTLHELKIYEDEKPADAPTIIVDLDSEYETRVGRALSATIQVEDASTYQWYKNTTNEAVFDEAHKIIGQTSATMSYTPVDSDEGKIYIYCYVTGTKAGSHVTTKVAEVTVLEASNGESGTAKLMWPMVDSDSKNTLAPNAIIVTGDIKNASDVFSACNNATLGSMLTNGSTKPGKFTDVTEPYAQTIPNTGSASTHLTPGTNAEVNPNAYIAYSFTPSVTFKPTNISFKVAVSGTGNGAAQPVLQYGAGASDKIVLADVFTPVRESNNVAQVISSYPISDISIEAGTLATFYIYAGGKIGNDKSFCVRDVIIEGDYVKEIITKCANPTVTKGAYDGATQKWTYTLACSTPNSKINYKIGDGEPQLNQNNPVQIAIAYNQSFSVWATDTETDSEKKLKDSKTITFTADAQPVLKNPTYTVGTYNTATKKFTVEIAAEDETTILYSVNGGNEQTYSEALQLNPADAISAKATRTGYVTSGETKATMLVPEWPGTEQTLKANGTSNNIGVSYTVGSTWVAGAANNLSDGLKLRTNSKVTKSDASELDNAFRIAVHPGFVIKKIDVTIQSNNESGTHTLDGIFVDEAAESITPSVALPLALPMTKATPSTTTFTIDNIRAKESIDFAFTNGTAAVKLNSNQANAMFTIYYEFIDDLASVTIDDEPLADDKLATLKSTQTVVLDGEFPEDPVVKMTSILGYEYTIKAGEVDESNNTIFAKSFYNNDSEDKNYVIKANVNVVKSPNIEIAEDMSLKGGYKVTLKYIEAQEVRIAPYINIDNTGWVAYDPEKEYYALATVQSKMMYGTNLESETVARSASCPSNSYEAGKPFAVYLYVNGYSDNQVGTHAYNKESFETDKIYNAVANQFNVIPIDVKNNNGSILDIRSDINDAKLVVITETLSNSGSVEIEGVGSKGTQLGLTLKRDVLDHTNVLNMKMFMNGSSSANNQRWQWAQPRAMASELTSIMPCTPDGGGMYEIFGNATMSRDASINLWDDIDTENMLYHLQPVFNFNEENETRPNFTPLALVIDSEEPEDQREEYHAIHFYKKNGFQYVAFGLSINEWPQYNNNVYAIVNKIGEMIKVGKSLDSKLTGIVKPQITDNGDGSANVMNNNLNADTYYVVYTETDATSDSFVAPTADYIINNGTKANDNDFHTLKYTEKMHIFAVSKLGTDATSEVVEGTVEGNSIRYVIRENEDPAAQGMVANYPFDLTVNSGTFNMPYNQSWKKDGYTVTAWEVTSETSGATTSSGTSVTRGAIIMPGETISGLTQDITVKALWTENTKAITDLGKNETKEQRTVTWEFLQSKGAPALAMENKAGNMQAILVGQVHFNVYDDKGVKTGEEFIDVPMTINTDNLAVLPDNGTEYHGKFNNVSTNWTDLKDEETILFEGSDYAQVRTGTQFTFPMVYGSNIVYKAVELVEKDPNTHVANGNVNRPQISQSYITDGSKTSDNLKIWKVANPGYELDSNGKIVMVDGVAQLAKTSPMYEAFKNQMDALGYDNTLYDEDSEHHATGGNFNYGGLIYYNGDATMATLTSVESAQYIHVGATTGKTLGGLNYGSVFMQSLSVTYPKLYDLTCTWNPAKSDLDPEENPGKIEKLNDPRPNCGGRYVLNDDIILKLTPSYGYYVDVDNDEVKENDVVTKEAYYFLKDGVDATSRLDITNNGVIKNSHIYRYKDAGYSGYSQEVKDSIPVDGACIVMKVMDIDLVVSMKKWPTVKYNVAAEPSTFGYVTFNSGNGRPHDDEYKEFPEGKTIYITAHPNTEYKFKEWRRNSASGEILVSQAEYDALVGDKTGYMVLPTGVTKGDGIMVNPFDSEDKLEKDEMMFTVSEANNDFTYVAIFEKGKTGIAYYEFDRALLKTSASQKHTEMTPLEITTDDRNQFPKWAESKALNIPEYYTLFKPGYTLDHWVEIEGTETGTKDDNVFTPTKEDDKFVYADGEKEYRVGTFYYFESEGESKHLVPVFTKNTTSYDYRATAVDITWDLRLAENAQRVNFKSGTNGNTAADTKIYYSTHAKINNGLLIDVPLTITLGKKGKLVNNIEEEDKWCAMGEGTEIVIPSGLGAKFTIASLSKMETTAIDGVVPTSYTVENIDGADVYLYTYTTQSEATSVTLKIGDDYSYYKYIRAELPAADAVPLTTTVNNPAFGTVEIAAARTTADVADNEALLKKINATKVSLPAGEGQDETSYTLNLGTIVSLHAKREHLYVLDYFEDGEGHRYYYNKDDETKPLTVKDKDGKDITTAATAVDEYLKMEKVQDIMKSPNDIQLTFQVQSYSESMHAVYKENTLYQVNYTSGEEAEGEAPGMTLVEDGESFTVPAENHHLYVDGQTLRYWVDEDGNKYDLGQSYILGQTFTASKDLPSGIAKDDEFTVPKKDIFLTPVFKVNDFTVMNLSQTATATWPLSRKGGDGYEGNGDIVINYEGINGIYVTPLKLSNGDFIDLKMDIRGENGKANNVNSTERCQVNSGTVFGMPSSSNCTFTLNSANSAISAKIDAVSVEGQQSVSSNYTGDKTQIDINFTGNTYLYEVVAEYKPVTTDLPELDYATVGNISLGALGTPLASVKLSALKSAGEVSGVPADLSNSTTGIMPVVRGTATRGGYVEVTQATIDNPVATMLVKTRDGVTVSVYKIGFDITYPDIAPRVTDLKIDRKFQCDLQKMYENAIKDTRVDGTNYLNDDAYLRHLGMEGKNADNERVAINGVINIKFSTKMAETAIPASTFKANGTGIALGQAVYALEGQTLTFTYKGLAVNTEYDFIIPAGTFKDVFWADAAKDKKAIHVYNEPIRIHFSTVETAITTDRRVINYVVTHNQASHFDATEAKMVADGAPVQVASSELIANLEAAGIEHGTLDHGVELANAYKESGKRFYIFVPDGEYQLMGNDLVKSVSSPIGEDGKVISALDGKQNVYSGITTVSRDNVSITGQSQEKTIVYNHPAFEGLSNASTLKLNNGIANFYAQDMTLQNRFDFLRCRKVSSKGVAPVLWDRSAKAIFKNVKFDSYQDTYYTNANNQLDDTRGYAEDCTIMGYVDFICGDGDHWFQNSNMVVRQGVGSTATNMFAPRQYETQKWGYVMDHCSFSAENNTAFDVNNGKMTIARPWANSPASSLIECTYNVLSTDDGYKKMTDGGLIIRMQEYKSYDSDGKILDLSKRSLRNSSPGIGSYDAVMTPSKAAEYNLYDVMGGEDGYDPTLYTAQVNMPKDGIKQDDTFLTWDDKTEALCYFIFMSDTENGDYKLFAITPDTEFEMGNAQINKWFVVRAANQRGGLGEPTDRFQYKAHESYKRELASNNQVVDGWRWSTIYLDFDAKAPVVQQQKVVDGVPAVDGNGAPVMEDEIYVYALVKVDATKLTFKRVKTMEKNVGYLIKARPRPEEYEFKYTEKTPVYWSGQTVPEYRTAQSLSAADFPHMSLMDGSETDIPADGIAGYTLASKVSYGLGFYKYIGNQYNANYAWLDAALVAEAQKALAENGLEGSIDKNSLAAARAGFMKMVFEDDDLDGEGSETDGIHECQIDDDADQYYDLQGFRVAPNAVVSGRVYIKNGRKVQVK